MNVRDSERESERIESVGNWNISTISSYTGVVPLFAANKTKRRIIPAVVKQLYFAVHSVMEQNDCLPK